MRLGRAYIMSGNQKDMARSVERLEKARRAFEDEGHGADGRDVAASLEALGIAYRHGGNLFALG